MTANEILDTIFAEISDEVIDRDLVARAFEDVARSLRSGTPPQQVAVICEGAAEAIRAPELHLEIARRTAARVTGRI